MESLIDNLNNQYLQKANTNLRLIEINYSQGFTKQELESINYNFKGIELVFKQHEQDRVTSCFWRVQVGELSEQLDYQIEKAKECGINISSFNYGYDYIKDADRLNNVFKGFKLEFDSSIHCRETIAVE